MMKTHARTLGAFLTLWTLLSAGACSDPAGLDGHSEPEGVVLRIGGQVVASYDVDNRRWTGEVSVAAGQTTGQISVQFVDHDGRPISLGSGYYLEVEVGNTTVAAFNPTTPGAFTGTVQGKVAGQTTAVFKLMHGTVGRGHSDLSTAPVTVRVTG